MKAYALRRRSFASALEDGVALFPSAPVRVRSNDIEYHYRQESNFHFLTGFPEPESWLAIVSNGDEKKTVLFVRPKDPERETWEGRRAGPEGAMRDFGADEAYTLDQLEDFLLSHLGTAPRLYYAVGRNDDADRLVFRVMSMLRRRVRQGFFSPAEIVDPASILDEMRLIKSDFDLPAIRHAARITAEGHVEAMRMTRPGKHEYDLQAALEYVFRVGGSPYNGYPCIVGSGVNATILHYRENDRRMEDGELVLVDAGAEYQGFSADITRTFPVNGRFSDPQRRLYELVLEAQTEAIRTVRPGSPYIAAHEVTLEVLTRGLIALGWIDGPLEAALENELYKPFYMHRTSHWLGIDVHDVGHYQIEGTPRPLKAGMLLTVEPGLYVSPGTPRVPVEYHGLGVRIEDDVLVTPEGHDILTVGAPKTVADIEAVMKSPSKYFVGGLGAAS